MLVGMRSKSDETWLYFTATPLHYLAARQVAALAPDVRHILLLTRPAVASVVEPGIWDAVREAPWPRFAPLPGAFGRLRRLLANLEDVGALVGPAQRLVIHSPVFDTEAVNYFLAALRRLCGPEDLRARILPDGLLNLHRHPLGRFQRLAQCLRKVRRLASPLLDYTCFSGDRTGSDAPFVDRIYTFAGFPHSYDPAKVQTLPPFPVEAQAFEDAALVVAQPLVHHGMLSPSEVEALGLEIEAWAKAQGIGRVRYKAHPRDTTNELRRPGYEDLVLDEPLECHLARTRYRAVLGVYSTALFTARQIGGPSLPILSFGMDRVRFRRAQTRQDVLELMDALDIRRQEA